MQDDDRVDEMVRAASAYAVDEARLAQGVLRRVREADRGIFGLFGSHLRGVAVAFGCVLMATPFVMTQVPNATEEAVIAGLLLGEGILDDGALEDLLGVEAVE